MSKLIKSIKSFACVSASILFFAMSGREKSYKCGYACGPIVPDCSPVGNGILNQEVSHHLGILIQINAQN